MNTEQADLCARVLSSIAWSDGELSNEEMSRVVDLICLFDYLERPRIQEILMTPSSLAAVDAIQDLPRHARIRLLHDAYLVASCSGRIGLSEQAPLKQIVETVVTGKSWEEIDSCLRCYSEYESPLTQSMGHHSSCLGGRVRDLCSP